jgi:putative tryptophan/tyrosine transport system substrate-binding protein
MRRRDFITLLGGMAVARPLAARAQQPALPVVGFLNSASPETNGHNVEAFRKGLSETGYVEGRNVTVEFRWANNDYDRLPDLAADLVRRKVSVLVAPGNLQSALAAKAATTTIPIVFQTGADPVTVGLVASLNRPGGNVTGISSMNLQLDAKRLGLLHELLPGAARFAVLLNPNQPTITTDVQIREVQAAAAAISRQVEIVYASTIPEIDTAFATIAQKGADAVLLPTSALFIPLRAQITAMAARHMVPAIYWDRAFVEAGGLLSYGTDGADQFRQAGVYAGRILKGEKPADLPVQQTTKFELVINLKTAKSLGLTVPPSLLAIADEVIE